MDDIEANPRTAAQRLQLVNEAIEEIMIAGQSYKIGSRQLTRADLKQLRLLKNDLANEVAAEQSSGSLFTHTSVAMFDGRR